MPVTSPPEVDLKARFARIEIGAGVPFAADTLNDAVREAIRDGVAGAREKVELGFPRFLGLAQLTGNQWLLCIGFAVALLLVDEVIKVFLRRSRSRQQGATTPAAPAPTQA